ALETSLPSVVRTLAALERELGVRLLNRTTRRIHLTDEGARYLERCRAILSAVQETEAAFTLAKAEPQGRLTVTASVLFGRRYIAPIVNAFLRRHPSVTAELLFVDRVVNMVEEGIDVAARIGHLRDSSLVAVSVGKVRRVICASPEYLRRRGTPRAPPAGRQPVAVPLNVAVSCNDIDSSLEACLSGHGLGLFLSYQTAPYRDEKRLRYVLEEFENEPEPVHIVNPQSRLVSGK